VIKTEKFGAWLISMVVQIAVIPYAVVTSLAVWVITRKISVVVVYRNATTRAIIVMLAKTFVAICAVLCGVLVICGKFIITIRADKKSFIITTFAITLSACADSNFLIWKKNSATFTTAVMFCLASFA
jgi:hypothetical protein